VSLEFAHAHLRVDELRLQQRQRRRRSTERLLRALHARFQRAQLQLRSGVEV
jgi:hypothetical protein